jgi:hypothetical protein
LSSHDYRPTSQGCKPVVEIRRIYGASFGYDSDNDGQIDFARTDTVSRAGAFSEKLRKDDLEFKALQEKYLKKQQKKNFCMYRI